MARYRAIAADLAAKIRDGHYAPGEALPGQRELSAAYGVTLMTLRQALRELGAEGLIVQRPGKGTFVSPPHLAYQLGSLRSFADDLREQGHEVRTTVIGCAQRRVPPSIAARLRVRETGTGLRLERVRAFAGRRAIHQVSWVREPHADRLRDVDFTTTSLYAALADAGVVVARASETIRPELLDADVARQLDEDVGAPVLVSDRITYGPDGTALVADRATILGSMMQITADRAATGLSLHWGATPSDRGLAREEHVGRSAPCDCPSPAANPSSDTTRLCTRSSDALTSVRFNGRDQQFRLRRPPHFSADHSARLTTPQDRRARPRRDSEPSAQAAVSAGRLTCPKSMPVNSLLTGNVCSIRIVVYPANNPGWPPTAEER